MANKIIIEKETAAVDDNSTANMAASTDEKIKEKSKLTGAFQKVADFDFNISNEWLMRQIPFGLFVVGLLLLHIWNGHNVERVIRKTDKLNKEIKELRSEYISIFSELMSESKQSSVAKKLDTLGIKELTTPPIKITTTSGN